METWGSNDFGVVLQYLYMYADDPVNAYDPRLLVFDVSRLNFIWDITGKIRPTLDRYGNDFEVGRGFDIETAFAKRDATREANVQKAIADGYDGLVSLVSESIEFHIFNNVPRPLHELVFQNFWTPEQVKILTSYGIDKSLLRVEDNRRDSLGKWINGLAKLLHTALTETYGTDKRTCRALLLFPLKELKRDITYTLKNLNVESTFNGVWIDVIEPIITSIQGNSGSDKKFSLAHIAALEKYCKTYPYLVESFDDFINNKYNKI